jgi:CRP-like cAMP-binding protein
MDKESHCRRFAASSLDLAERRENVTDTNKRPATVEAWVDFANLVKTIKIHKNIDFIVTGNRYESLYINHDGWLFRYKILHNGRRQILGFILPEEIFGLQACLYKSSLYSVAAITDASLSAIPANMLNEIFERSPAVSNALFFSALCESAVLGEHLIDTGRRSAYERISHFLLELFARLSPVGLTNDLSFKMPLTQELIGDALGLTTIHVNRTICLLREDKLIAIDGKCVTLLDYEALSLLSDFENSYLAENITVRNGVSTSKFSMATRRTANRRAVNVSSSHA